MACAAGLLLPAAPAVAAFGPGAVVASATDVELGDRDSRQPLLSGDGRYVVFATSASALLGRPARTEDYYASGWVRKDLATGAAELVATPEARRRSDDGLVTAGVAQEVAGISDDGRYVLFTSSAAGLVPEVLSSITPEVYVRDMRRPRSDQSAYELVSATDGSRQPARYADRTVGSSAAIRGFSLSDDGRTALFVTQTESSLPSWPGLDTPTPRWQVFVRDLDALATRLVTRDLSDPTLPGTAVPPETVPRAFAPQAALSGDGNVVAWAGSNAERQARFLVGEQDRATMDLLWRDLRSGPAAPARRVAGEADPDDPGCPADAEFVPSPTALGPCYGPFAAPEEQTVNTPVLPEIAGISDDGRRVLFVVSSWLRGSPEVYRPASGYVSDMAPGLPRKLGVSIAWSQAANRQAVRTGTLAGDGRHAAFVSLDNEFTGFQHVGSFQTTALIQSNVFAADLVARTVERTTVAPTGADYFADGSGSTDRPSMSDDGATIAFSAPDGNLFIGDVNRVRDVLVVRRSAPVDRQASRRQPSPPAPPMLADPPLRTLPTTAFAVGQVRVSRRGVATLPVRLPAAGTLVAEARGRSAQRRRRVARVRVGRYRRSVRRAADVVVRIRPSARVRRLLRRRAPRRVRVDLRLRFDARSGGRSRHRVRYVLGDAAVVRSAR